MKIHLRDKSLFQKTEHIAFGIYRNLKTACGKDGNKVLFRENVYKGEEPLFCKKCLKKLNL